MPEQKRLSMNHKHRYVLKDSNCYNLTAGKFVLHINLKQVGGMYNIKNFKNK